MLTRDQKNQNSLNLFLNNYFNIILVFILIIILTAAYITLIKPKYLETKWLIQENLEQQHRIYAEQQKRLKNLEVVANLYSKIPSADLQKFNEVLPDNYIKERLFGELEEIITENGFTVNSISLEKTEEGNKINNLGEEGSNIPEKVGTVNLSLSLSAVNYSGLKNLLRLFENNLRLFDVRQIDFAPDDNSVDLNLSTYFYNH